ncbi:MAG: molybdenum cofactor biosynthesis protein MoaE [Candidatus Omnitrophota bacterium]
MFAISGKSLKSFIQKNTPKSSKAGALVSFEGFVRNNSMGHKISGLEYRSTGPRTLRIGRTILKEAKKKFDVYELRCVHRIGRLKVGDRTIWIAALSAHRDEAFKACRYVIEELKKRLPILKKEIYVSDY